MRLLYVFAFLVLVGCGNQPYCPEEGGLPRCSEGSPICVPFEGDSVDYCDTEDCTLGACMVGSSEVMCAEGSRPLCP